MVVPLQAAVTLLAAAGVQSAHAASPASSTIAKAGARDRAAAIAARRQRESRRNDSSELPDIFRSRTSLTSPRATAAVEKIQQVGHSQQESGTSTISGR